jgi:hypothetical protein
LEKPEEFTVKNFILPIFVLFLVVAHISGYFQQFLFPDISSVGEEKSPDPV